MEIGKLALARKMLLNLSAGNDWHATDALKTDAGRAGMETMSQIASNFATFRIAVCAPIELSDRLGEAARAQLLRNLIDGICEAHEIDRVILDRRLPGYQRQADLRLLREFSDKRKHIDFRLQNRHEEILLRLPDLAASAYRRLLVANDERFWKYFATSSHIANS